MQREVKKCCKCGKELPIDEFYKNKCRPDGHQDMCKECFKEAQKAYYYRVKAKQPAPVVKQEEKKAEKPVVESVFFVKKATDKELVDELKGRGMTILINPTPRDLMQKLRELGYSGTLEYYEKRTVNLNTAF